jgi:soluble lytic murein transglycosylase-like protein
MKYLIMVLLSALFVALTAPTPALKNRVVHIALAAKSTHDVTPAKAVQSQPEKTVSVAPPVAAVTQTPVAETTTYASGCGTYDSLFRQYAWDVTVAEAICQAESRGNPYAASSTNDYGLMQIHDGLSLYGSQIYDPAFNVRMAYGKYQRQGWEAWTTYNLGYYLAFL